MAILRDSTNSDDSINYLTTLAFFCCVSCITLMLKFKGFKASLNILSGKLKTSDKYEKTSTDVPVTGAYRINRDEFFGTGRPSDPPRKLAQSLVKLPTSSAPIPPPPPPQSKIRSVQSTGNLLNHSQDTPKIRPAASVSLNPTGDDSIPKRQRDNRKSSKNEEKEQKKLEKQRLMQEKARQKQESQELARQDKLKREQERKASQQAKKQKKRAPVPQTQPELVQDLPQTSNALGQAPVRHNTNTLESSISRSSGPPPYSEEPKTLKDNASTNVTFGKPIDTGSWDMISQHRQQIGRPLQTSTPKEKRMVMDLNYNFNNSLSIHDDNKNSEA